MKVSTRIAAARKLAKRVANRTDKLLVRAGTSARKRLKSRNRSKLRTAGKMALVVGVGAATAYAGRRIANRVGTRRKTGTARKK
jgi:hypothetical protein